MSTTTPNYNFILPGVNDPTDANLWGTQLNSNFTNLDSDLKAVSDAATSAAASYGDLKATAASAAPSLWLLCYGQAIDRTTYSGLFGAIGTTWGVGNGTTTFNVPDFRGRTLVGKDNMGGSAANRITAAISGITGTTLGSSGGDESTQLHTHTATSVVTDPGHVHQLKNNTGSSTTAVFQGGGSTGTNVGPVSSSTTGITVATTNADFGAGSSQNVQPSAIVNWLIYSGV